MSSAVMQQIGTAGVIPIIVLNDVSKAVELARAILAGGIGCVEITLRTAVGIDAIHQIAQAVPEILIGAGTVLSIDQAEVAVAAGARFIVTPGFDDDVVSWCQSHDVHILPGAVTPTEITHARKKGIFTIKFFPADLYGGPNAVKSLSGPFNDMQFVVTSGVNADTLASYLKVPAILACGGSWIAPSTLIDDGEFEVITRLAREAAETVKLIRGK